MIATAQHEYRRADGSIAGAQARVVDFEDPDNNDWLAVNQFTVVGPQGHNRRADIVIFVNGLRLGVIELKNPADEQATIGSAFRQLETHGADMVTRQQGGCADPSNHCAVWQEGAPCERRNGDG